MKCCGCLCPTDRGLLSAEGHKDQEQKKILSLLLERLDDLGKDQLERFHFYLSREPPQGYKPILKSYLEGLSRTRTVKNMLERYGSKGAVKVTLYILEKMDLNEQADTLRSGLASTDLCERAPGPRPSPQLPDRIAPPITSVREGPVAASYREPPQASGGTISGAITDRQPQPSPAVSEHDSSLRAVQENLKVKLKKRYQYIFEGVARHGQSALLINVYTEVFITEGDCRQVNTEHEIWNIESVSKNTTVEDKQIECNKIFKPLPGQEDHVKRSVLTKGIAGIGKTVLVQKFILDWGEGKANRDIDLIFPLPFRELNLMKDTKLSLLGLIQHYHPEMKQCTTLDLNSQRVLFIFDGLDECRLPLNFLNQVWCDETKELPLDMLLTNLIQGNLLPSSLLWITSRPAAANLIPPECIQRVTEVRGFNDAQKDEYFRKKFNDQKLASRIISTIKSSRSLHIMCHIPVFCWISAIVLERLWDKSDHWTLTQMYTQFLLIQIMMKNRKYHASAETNKQTTERKEIQETDKEMTVNLGKLALKHLEKNNLIFYEEDLIESGIDINKTSEYSGLYTEIFKEELMLYEEKTFCFVHLSIQEYLAALSVHYLYANSKENPLNLDMSKHTRPDGGIKLSAVHKSAVDKALQSPNGHLDLFLRFLLGISLESKALSGLLPQTENSSYNVLETVQYIKEQISRSPSPERTINLFHCLNELNDDSLVEGIQSYLQSGDLSSQRLSPDQCSALAYVLLMSAEKQVDVLDMRMYNTTQAGYRRLLPVLKHTRTALLQSCDLTPALCTHVTSVLQSPTSLLRELDLSYNRKLGDKGCRLLCKELLSPHCRLQALRLGDCSLTKGCCDDLAAVLHSRHSQLRELDLRDNDLLDCGVTLLSAGLEDPLCKLQKLGLSGCRVTERGCQSLAKALHSNPSHLIELDLSYNHPGDLGQKVMSARLQDPTCTLKELIVEYVGECRMKPGMHKFDCHLTLDPSTAAPHVILSEGNRKALRKYAADQYTGPVLCKEALTNRCYWEVEWGPGSLEVGVAYQISTVIFGALGSDDQSWALRCDPEGITAAHNNKYTRIMRLHAQMKYRVGVYLDWPNGTLAFYKISTKGPIHVHTFHVTFTKPLYPAFALSMDVPMTLC